mmetsp:Transcript_71401/g.167268  ORF Transcript_71401/g.167268 Transcript_71401/m.167268 type:complete len:245 (-) Transcript_71401:69-803(-)
MMMEPMEPLSPTSAMICQSLQYSPPIAVVHETNLRRPASKSSSGVDSGSNSVPLSTYGHAARTAAEMVLRPASSGEARPARQARASKERTPGYYNPPEMQAADHLPDGTSLRLLSEDEVTLRASEALSYFRETREINQHARSVEEMEAALARARRRRHSEDLRPKQILALQEALEESDTEEHEEVHEMKTLAERMGYGVKTNHSSKWKKKVKEEKPKRVGGFASIQAGGNDLLSRLRQRRATIE